MCLAYQDLPQEQGQVLPSDLSKLQHRVLKAEATLGQKEEENAALREQLKQSEAKWSEYEAKMKAMEETWQKQMASLQMSLAAAKKNHAAGQDGRLDTPSPGYYDSEGTLSMETRTPGANTPVKLSNVGAGRESNGNLNTVSHLAKEFEQRKQSFDDDAKTSWRLNLGSPLQYES
ncbi:Myosin-2 [Vitis vinifera]|uniref:Myosin-2 n=1 Tax=Vitis vinifera TaxID=29760 RepID=A0A438I8M7_VITVI|nr:Myosin-2 [Vitis vinifera]